MKITTIGRGTIGGTLARLWTSAGHQVTELGRAGGDAADADVVLVAVPSSVVADALAGVTGLGDRVVIDATNRLGGEAPPPGYASVTEYVKANTGGPVAKAFKYRPEASGRDQPDACFGQPAISRRNACIATHVLAPVPLGAKSSHLSETAPSAATDEKLR